MRIATRGSELALWQARHVESLLQDAGACESVELVIVSTSGDRDKSTPLHQIGGKGVFVKEVQAALLDGRADLAVHSAKDMPAISPPELALGAVPERGNPHDVLVGARFDELPQGALIGTGSVRRRAQLAALRPDLTFAELRGNIGTRLEQLDKFDAIVMAAAALDRLGETPAIVDTMAAEQMVPQVGQGALAIECRADDAAAVAATKAISHAPSEQVFLCEQAFLRELGGDCSLPAGAHAILGPEGFSLTGFLASEDLATSFQHTVHGTDGPAMGAALAADLRSRLDG
jgi:hydroxymethylbilane synthase